MEFGPASVAETDNAAFAASRATAPFPFGRFDPVPSPPLALTADETSGETVERFVVRSNYTPASDEPAAPNANPLTLKSDRHVLPPKTSVMTAERHGKFDDNGGMDPSFYAMIADRDKAKLPGVPGPEAPTRAAVPVTDPEASVLYLPDPLAKGVTFRGLPGTNGPLLVSFGDPNAWPVERAFRLALRQGTGAPQFVDDAEGRRWEVYLDKADVATVRISSHVLADAANRNNSQNADLLTMGLWQWLDA